MPAHAAAAHRPRTLRHARIAVPVRPVLALVLLLAALAGGWLLVRDSGLVAVQRVDVTGATGTQAAAIERAARTAAQEMTTLHVRPDVVRSALRPFAIVRDVSVRTHFPHGLTVTILEHRPVAALDASGRRTPVAADGTILRGADAGGLPDITVRTQPGGQRLRDRRGRAVVGLVAAAPAPLRARVARAFVGPRGLTARLRSGPALIFGSSDRMAAKWAAVAAVLASPAASGATSIDVRVPERPAAAGLAPIVPAGQDPAAATTTPAVPTTP